VEALLSEPISATPTRKKLGYLPQDFGLYPTLTAAQMLDYLAKLKGVIDQKKAFACRCSARKSQSIRRAQPAALSAMAVFGSRERENTYVTPLLAHRRRRVFGIGTSLL
jgi:ABC-type lipoprotein export system ATPase subunit